MRKLLPLLIIGCVTSAHAVDRSSARVACDEIMSQIEVLSAKANRTGAENSELQSLRAKYSTQCQRSSGTTGRRTNARSISSMLAAKNADVLNAENAADNTADTAAPADDVDSFLKKKQENCQQLNDAIEKLKSAEGHSEEDLAKMQAQYDADCVEKPAEAEVAATEEAEPEMSEEEKAAAAEAAAEAEAQRIADLIAQGLCADGTKPNKYGCCTGETFKDIGNLQFACCKDDTNECFPPMQ